MGDLESKRGSEVRRFEAEERIGGKTKKTMVRTRGEKI